MDRPGGARPSTRRVPAPAWRCLLALLAATGNFAEIPMHVRATANTGASPQDVLQSFMHVAVYAGVPKANHAIKLAKETFAEMEAAQ